MTASSTVPKIPSQLRHLPVTGGLAVPWVTLDTGDGRRIMGMLDNAKQEEALRQRLCGVCGKPLGEVATFFVCDNDFVVHAPGTEGWSFAAVTELMAGGPQAKRLAPDEPALTGISYEAAVHRRCAEYSRSACPMIAGSMGHYRSSAPKLGPQWQPVQSVGPGHNGRPSRPFFELRVASYAYEPGDEQAGRRSRALLGPHYLSLRPVAELFEPTGREGDR